MHACVIVAAATVTVLCAAVGTVTAAAPSTEVTALLDFRNSITGSRRLPVRISWTQVAEACRGDRSAAAGLLK
jgi:hypothetical protein